MRNIAKILVLAFIFSLFATACGSAEQEIFDVEFVKSSDGIDLEGVTVKYMRGEMWGGTEKGEVLGYEGGTILADLAMSRIKDIETNMNCTLDIVYGPDQHKTFQLSNAAGSYFCDIICSVSDVFRNDMKAGALVGLSTVSEFLDYQNEAKWGNGNMLEMLCWEDDVYGFVPLSWPTSSVSYTGLTVVNEDLIASLNVTDPRDLYENGEWTWETFRECLKKYYVQEGNEIKHYALSAAAADFGSNYILSNGHRIAEKDFNGNYISGLHDPRSLKAMEEAQDVYNGSLSYTIDRTSDILQGPIDALLNGTAVMGVMHYAEYVPTKIAKEMTNFGVLPWPSGPDVEPGYLATHQFNLERAIVLSRFSPNIDVTAIVINALYEPFEEYPDSNSIKDFLYNTFFFDRRDADIYYDLFMVAQCSYFGSSVCGSICDHVLNGQTPTQYIESVIDSVEEYIEEEISPSKKAVEAVWGDAE